MGVYIPYTRLPSEYQEVEYIGRNGNNYIDTGWVPKLTAPFEVKVGYKISTSGVRYGVLSNYNGNAGEAGLTSLEINDGSHTNNVARFYSERTSGSNTANIYSSNTLNVSGFNDLVYTNNGSSSGSVTLNGITTNGSVKTDGYSNLTAYLFIDRSLRWTTFSNNSFISYCKIYESGTLVRDFVPCYRKSDSVIGLYDLVNNQFYTNAGTGTFSKGNDVTMVDMKNAYIGEYTGFEYSYDFRNKTTSQFTADGWTTYEGTAYFDADGIYGSSGTLRNKINLQLDLTNAKKITIVENYKWTGSSAGTRNGLAVVSDMTHWNGVYLQGTARGIDLDSTFTQITNSASSSTGTFTETLVLDLINKTYTVSGHWSYTVSLTDAQISSIRSTTGLYVMLYTSNYIRVQNVSLTIEG